MSDNPTTPTTPTTPSSSDLSTTANPSVLFADLDDISKLALLFKVFGVSQDDEAYSVVQAFKEKLNTVATTESQYVTMTSGNISYFYNDKTNIYIC